MPFRLGKSTRDWFKHIRDSFEVDFDMYYVCVMAGLLSGDSHPVVAADAPEVLEYFPEVHRAYGNVIVGLLLAAEFRRAGLRATDRKQIHTIVRDLVNPRDPSHLSEAGFAAMNAYAEAGGRMIRAEFEDPPQLKSAFLVRYVEFVQQLQPRALLV